MKKLFLNLFLAFILFGVTLSAFSQQTKVKPPVTPKPAVVTEVIEPARRSSNESDLPVEKAITTDKNVNISVCFLEGKVEITGWDRNEVRIFVEDGSKAGFRVLRKNDSGKANWLMIQAFEESERKKNLDECLFGNVEINVPKGANVSLKSRDADILVESVNKLSAKTVNGKFDLREVANGTDLMSWQSEITGENLNGRVNLNSDYGSINVFDAKATDICENFSAKTSGGSINVKNIEFSDVILKSTSGTINWTGGLMIGGSYDFTTTSGAITAFLPDKSSFKLTASYGMNGSFSSEILLSSLIKPGANNPIKKLTATSGSGDANLKLGTDFSGSLRIKKF